MVKDLGLSGALHGGSARKEVSFRGPREILQPQVTYRRRVSNKMAFVGMAVGYLGLVVVLASVPIWNQMLLPYETPIAACLDFGGSR